MASESDIFKKINDSVLDLQSSGQQTYERPLKTLGRLLQDPVLGVWAAEVFRISNNAVSRGSRHTF